jgi:UDP-2-acetamido-2-deoxy-ribo-hexuluronate aminotransferase
MEFVDLKTQFARLEDDIRSRIDGVLAHGQFILGPEVEELEQKLAAYTNSENCIGVASGTDGLLVSLMALRVGPGDEVICPAFSFYATCEVIQLLGATPIFADIHHDTFNIDPGSVQKLVGTRTKAIVAVSLFGQVSDMDELNDIAQKCDTILIEDAAQSFGAEFRGKKSCSLSPIAVTSFFPSKPLGAYGDAGAVFISDDVLAKSIRQISRHGQEGRYEHIRVGLNGRLDTIQAAVLLAKLNIYDDEVRKRNEKAETYNSLITEACPNVQIPVVLEHNLSVYAQYTIRVSNRDEVKSKLKAEGVPTAVHYPIPMTGQLAVQDSCAIVPESENAASSVLSLPMHPYLALEQQQEIVHILGKIT